MTLGDGGLDEVARVLSGQALKADPAVVTVYAPWVCVAGAVKALSPDALVRPPIVPAVILLPLTVYVDPILVACVAAPSTVSCVEVDNLCVKSALT